MGTGIDMGYGYCTVQLIHSSLQSINNVITSIRTFHTINELAELHPGTKYQLVSVRQCESLIL